MDSPEVAATSVLRSTIAISRIVFFASISFLSRSSLHSHHQLFRESEQCHATLRTNAMLPFLLPCLMHVLMAALIFDVASCITHCGRLLRNLPMTPESVLVYHNLPSTVLMAKAFQPLTVAAKQFYAVHYKDITKFEDEILSLPLAGVRGGDYS